MHALCSLPVVFSTTENDRFQQKKVIGVLAFLK